MAERLLIGLPDREYTTTPFAASALVVSPLVILRMSSSLMILYLIMYGQLLDFLWMTERHDLCHPSCLIAKDAEQANKIDAKVTEAEPVAFGGDMV